MEMVQIERGWSVFSEDGKRVGDVVEVHPHYLLVSRGLLVVRDIYVPRYAVGAVEERKIHLSISEERLRRMGWNAPPPPPPMPPDSASPRLVPSYAQDEFGPPPLEFGGAAAPEEGSEESPYGDSGAYVGADLWAGDSDSSAYAYTDTEPYYDDYEDLGIMFGSSVEVDGDAYLTVRRVGEGPPIVLIHGWGFDARIWDYLLLDLPRDHTVVTYNARGYGGSTATWGGYDVERAAHDLRVVLRTLELDNATLVGLDIGAAAAMRYVLSGGRRAGRLIMIAPAILPFEFDADAPPASEPELEPPPAWHSELRRDRPRLAAQLTELWAPAASAETHAWLRDGIMAAAPHTLQQGLETLGRPEVDGELRSITLPTIVLHGRDDPVVPLERGEDVAGAIPGARLVILDAQGHLPMLADPERVVAEIRAAVAEGEEPQGAVTPSEEPQELEEPGDTDKLGDIGEQGDIKEPGDTDKPAVLAGDAATDVAPAGQQADNQATDGQATDGQATGNQPMTK